MGELLAEAIGWLLEMLAPAATTPDVSTSTETSTERVPTPPPSRGDVVRRWLGLLFGGAFVVLSVAAPILWASGSVDGVTLVGLVVAALIAGRTSQLLRRFGRERAAP